MFKLIDDGWMYIHIPKTSGGNLKKIIIKYYSGEYFIFDKNFNDIDAPIVDLLWEQYESECVKTGLIPVEYFNIAKSELLFEVQHSPLWVWQKSGMYNGEKIMTIVRNPYTKFISHYYASIYYLDKYFEFSIPSPSEFINHEKINKILKMDPCNYLVNQVNYLKDINGDVKCDKIYKMETDLVDLERDFKLKEVNKFKFNQAEYDRNYRKLYTDELIHFVQETYKNDFEYFGYAKEPFW
jgi:hypothetical protein